MSRWRPREREPSYDRRGPRPDPDNLVAGAPGNGILING
jgi:hypothetical protein